MITKPEDSTDSLRIRGCNHDGLLEGEPIFSFTLRRYVNSNLGIPGSAAVSANAASYLPGNAAVSAAKPLRLPIDSEFRTFAWVYILREGSRRDAGVPRDRACAGPAAIISIPLPIPTDTIIGVIKRTDPPRFDTDTILEDYRIAFRSRLASIIGRQEVFAGKAKFGIFGDGKEVAQVAIAHAFRKGDFRSGYYRDQTLMFALGLLRPGGILCPTLWPRGSCCRTLFRRASHDRATLPPDCSTPTAAGKISAIRSTPPPTCLPPARRCRVLSASPSLRNSTVTFLNLQNAQNIFSSNGNEIAFGTIGNASCAEGVFWESINAIGVLQVPMLLAIWDDGYGISVPNELQIAKADISNMLEGFQRRDDGKPGIAIHKARGWDYPELCDIFCAAADDVRRNHAPAIVHVTELTQPQGHSTSGSQERYKPAERLEMGARTRLPPQNARMDHPRSHRHVRTPERTRRAGAGAASWTRATAPGMHSESRSRRSAAR